MNSFLDYRKMAQLKHQKYKEETERKEKEALEMIENEVAEKLAEEMNIQDEINHVNNFILELDNSIILLQESDDIFLSLELIKTQLDSMIFLIKKNNKLKEVQELITTFVDTMNKISENKKNKSPKYVNNLQKIIKEIIILSEVDIDIEMMDTTDDEKFAKELQDELYKSEDTD
jgi:hypothetical protein